MDYHAPTDCEIIKRWLTKCADDSETANYISAHTKDVSGLTIEFEKNEITDFMKMFSVPNVTYVSRRMEDVTTCSATIANMIFVGCV